MGLAGSGRGHNFAHIPYENRTKYVVCDLLFLEDSGIWVGTLISTRLRTSRDSPRLKSRKFYKRSRCFLPPSNSLVPSDLKLCQTLFVQRMGRCCHHIQASINLTAMAETKSIKRKLIHAGGWQIAKRTAKMIPLGGTIVAVGLVGHDIKRKGVVKGVLNSGLDAIPILGLAKNVVELVTGDFIPDKDETTRKGK